MSTSKSRFTVAKLDAGMAILLTSDHHLIEFPSLLLPSGVAAGSIIDLSVAQNTKKEKEENDKFVALQKDIRDLFAVHPPSTPELTVRNMTQTSVVLEWDLIDLATAEMKSLTLYKNGSKLGKIPSATTTTTKLSGLALDTDYTFQLVLKSTAGVYKSKELKVRTHKMTNLTGLNVCISNVKTAERTRVAEILARLGAKPPHEKVRIDTTHFITERGAGEEFKKAQNMNIPIVIPEFVEACEAEGRLMRAGSYYLDADPALRTKRSIPASSNNNQSPSTTTNPSEQPSNSQTEPDSASTTAPHRDSVLMNNQAEVTTKSTETPEAESTSMATQIGDAVLAAANDAAVTAQETAQAGVEQVKSVITDASNASTSSAKDEANEINNHSKEEETVLPIVAAAPTLTTGNDERTTKAEIEPHQEAAESVVDLPSQLEQGEEAQTMAPTNPNGATVEDMEEVAL